MKEYSEEQIRLRELKRGPWYKMGSEARELISLNVKRSELRFAGEIDIRMFDVSNRNFTKKLNKTLKPHWSGATFSEDDLNIRNSFDEALTYLQLLELAVKTGYLNIDLVRPIARKEIVNLLWSEPARKFLENYDYLDIISLAKRVDVDLRIKTGVEKSIVCKSEEINFALFFSLLKSFYNNDKIDDFLGLLDGYEVEEIDSEIFYEFLKDGEEFEYSLDEIETFVTLYHGLQEFIFILDGLLSNLSKKDKLQFGGFFSYWIAKFFGYDLSNRRYIKSDHLFDWSKVAYQNVFLNYEFVFLNTDTISNRKVRHTIYVAVKNLKKVWEMIQENTEKRLARTQVKERI